MSKPKAQSRTTGTWNFREVPRDTMRKAKIAAAAQDKSVKKLLIGLVAVHWEELERKGILPKGK